MNIISEDGSIIIERPEICDFDITVNPDILVPPVSEDDHNLLSLEDDGLFVGLLGTGLVKSLAGVISYITGTSSQFIKADGSLDSSTYLTAEVDTLQTVSSRGATTTTSLTALSFIKSGGASTQFLKADGSIDSSTYLTSNQTITLTGDVSGTGTTAITTVIGAAKVTNAMLVNSGIIVNAGTGLTGGGAVSLGGTITLTNSAPDQTVVLTQGTGITITGTYPSFTIGLTNNSITIGSTSIALGGTSTVLAGLTSVTSTSFVGALTGNATTATALATGRTISITGDLAYTSPSFDGLGNVTAAGTLASIISAGGPTGSASVVPVITWDAKGRLTAVTTATIVAGSTAAALTMNNGGAGDVSGSTFNGSVAKTISYNTIGAPSTTGTGASGTWSIAITGNSGTTTALQTGRTINGTTFDGTVNITVTAAAGTLTGTTLNSTVVNSSLTSVGLLTTLSATLTSATTANILYYNSGTGLFTYGAAPASGTVTSVSVTTANGVSGSVANPTTTPAITLTLGAITPTSVVASAGITATDSFFCGASGGTPAISQTGSSGVAARYLYWFNTGGSLVFGVQNSVGNQGGLSGTTPYSIYFGSDAARSLHLCTNNAVKFTIASSGDITMTNNLTVTGLTSGSAGAFVVNGGSGLLVTRTAGQVLSDIGAAAALSGTTNYMSKFTSSTAIGNSQIFDNGTNVIVNGTSGPSRFNVIGTSHMDNTETYASGASYTLGLTNTATYTGSLPTSNASFSTIPCEFHPLINGATSVGSDNQFGSILATIIMKFTTTGTLTVASANAASAIHATTIDDGTINGIVTRSAGISINGIYLTAGASAVITRTDHYQLLVNDTNQFGGGGNITNKWGVYQAGASDKNFFAGEVTLGTGQVVSASVLNAVTNKIKLIVNGTTYYLLASTSGA